MPTTSRGIRVLSLFSGLGGLDIGFHDAGFKTEVMVELDKHSIATLRRNSGEGAYFGDCSHDKLDKVFIR